MDRRDFLQTSIASAVLAPTLFGNYAEAMGAEPKRSGPVPEPSTRTASSLIERLDYFPLESELVSLRGLAPPRDAQKKIEGSEAWISESTFSLRHIASWRHNLVPDLVFDQGVPNSVRELITPQLELVPPTYNALGWENWLDDRSTNARGLDVNDISSVMGATGVKETAEHDESGDQLYGFGGFDNSLTDKKGLLVQHVVRAARSESKFRAVGSGHSHSEAAKPAEAWTDMKEVSGKLEQNWLWDDTDDFWDGEGSDLNKNHLIRVGAGTILKRLNRDILPPEDLALPNMGSFDGQTVAGAINTSTHGTGLELGTFADLVQSVEIVCVPKSQYEEPESAFDKGTPYVRMLRVEPEDGITDPEKFAADTDSHGMALIQNDDLFHSVVVGYGCMGIVYAYTLRVRDAYWLEEDTTLMDWESLRTELSPSGGETEAEAVRNFVTEGETRHFQVLMNIAAEQVPDKKTKVNPIGGDRDYHEGPHNPVCMVRRHYEREPPEDGEPDAWKTRIAHGNDTRWPPERRKKTMEDIGLNTFLVNDLHPLKPNEGKAKQLHKNFFHPAENRPPFVAKRSKTASYIALRRLRDRKNFPPEPPTLATSMEVAVPLEHLVDAVERVREKVRDVRQKHWVNPPTEKSQRREYEIFFGVPMGIRFTAPSEHVLSPEFERPSAMIEIPFPIYEEGANAKLRSGVPNLSQEELRDEVAKPALAEIEKVLVSEFDGRPHLGKQNSVNTDPPIPELHPGSMFPEYEKWSAALAYLNRFDTFSGEFSRNKAGTE